MLCLLVHELVVFCKAPHSCDFEGGINVPNMPSWYIFVQMHEVSQTSKKKNLKPGRRRRHQEVANRPHPGERHTRKGEYTPVSATRKCRWSTRLLQRVSGRSASAARLPVSAVSSGRYQRRTFIQILSSSSRSPFFVATASNTSISKTLFGAIE